MISGLNIKTYFKFSDIEAQWRDLESQSRNSFFQSFDWCSSFYNSIGQHQNLNLCLVAAYDRQGELAFILPFQIRKKFGVHVLEWLAQAENNYGHGIFSPKFLGESASVWFNQNLTSVFSALPPFDVFNLQNMPLGTLGFPNIFDTLPISAAANSSYVTVLKSSYDNLLRSKRSAKSIGKIRRRDERILELGAVEFCVESLGAKTSIALAEAFAHKRKQLAEQGISGVFETPQSEFLLHLSQLSKLRAFRLVSNGQTLSTLIGAVYGQRFWLMITSLAPDAPRPLSPGDMLLRNTIAWCCEQNLELFDFSNGEIGYKTLWADEKVELSNYIVAKNVRGLALAAGLRFFHSLKRRIKSSDSLRNIFNLMRKKLKGRD